MSGELVRRRSVRLRPDPTRVITKLFVPGEETPHGHSRAGAVVARILALPEAEVQTLADAVVADFATRHHDLAGTFARHYAVVANTIRNGRRLSAKRRLLIGAYFTHEYAPEAAALFNPSMVSHPDQSGLAAGEHRFLMTVRCVGEGHISSIGFRTGVLGPGSRLVVDKPQRLLTTGTTRPASYRLRVFQGRLADLNHDAETIRLVLDGLPETFDSDQLRHALDGIHEHMLNRQQIQHAVEHVHQVAAATYDLSFPARTHLSERLMWPTAPVEANGMEDARLVRFEDDDAAVTYYATYTAYDGIAVRPHLLETKDFREFHISPTTGPAAQNKGLALFPRRIGGRYVALSRWDRESSALATSDDCRVWEKSVALHTPRRGWELIQVGNCGSPIETPAGWLVITHGVGPMRAYRLGAILLDLTDPSLVLATMPEPLLSADEDERDGYVPNVVYSCGALLHDDQLTIPYGVSDGAVEFAQVRLSRLLARMLGHPPRQRAKAAPARARTTRS